MDRPQKKPTLSVLEWKISYLHISVSPVWKLNFHVKKLYGVIYFIDPFYRNNCSIVTYKYHIEAREFSLEFQVTGGQFNENLSRYQVQFNWQENTMWGTTLNLWRLYFLVFEWHAAEPHFALVHKLVIRCRALQKKTKTMFINAYRKEERKGENKIRRQKRIARVPSTLIETSSGPEKFLSQIT